jgi:Ser/Thr protein kinase RdoA (MazF antagonist)
MNRPGWAAVAPRLVAALGEPVRYQHELGRSRERRMTWAVQGERSGPLVVKMRQGDRAEEKTQWAADYLPTLAVRGYPVPQILWHGLLDDQWHAVVLQRLPGRPLRAAEASLRQQLVALVELQADAGVPPGTRDIAEYHALVLFEGWDDVWQSTEQASPATAALCSRLRRWLEPVWGYRVGGFDFANNDLNFTNVLTDGKTITGVVDWDEMGINTRAVDLAAIADDVARHAGSDAARPLLDRIAEVVGDDGRRCVISYRILAHVLAAVRLGQQPELTEVVATAEQILDVCGAPAAD